MLSAPSPSIQAQLPVVIVNGCVVFVLRVHQHPDCLCIGVLGPLESYSSSEVVLCKHVLCAHAQMFLLESRLEVKVPAPRECYFWF